MKILYRQALWTLVIVLLVGVTGRYCLDAYQNHDAQRQALERIRFRHAFVQRQLGELQEKVKVIQQVNAFAEGADNLGLVPSNWTRYAVDVEAPMRFAALAEILRQCSSTPYYYFQPERLKVHLAGLSAEADSAAETGAAAADGGSAETGDLLLQLKGTFLARRR